MISVTYLLSFLMSSGVSAEDAKTLVCIAHEESKMKPNAINHKNKNGTKDYGLFQINSIWLDKCKVTPDTLLQVHTNISCALTVYETQGLEAWSTLRKCK